MSSPAVPSVSLLPQLTGSMFSAGSTPGLSDDERLQVVGLSTKLMMQSVQMRLAEAYYTGTQRLYSLGISIPPQLAGLRTVVDWPRICIDPLVQRLVVDGFRLPQATDADEEMWGHWQANDLDSEWPLCALDALIYGRGYMIVGSPDEDGDSPLVTVESPENMAMTWDPRTKQPTAAYQAYEVEGTFRAVLYLPDETVSMARQWTGEWAIEDRDQHGFGQVPVVRFPNRQRSVDREGQSEITPAVMNTTDSACRSLLGMEIAREFYSVPHRYILGASESDFTDAQGNAKSQWDMAMNKFLAIERDKDGNVPTIGQFTAFDPSTFTKIVDKHAQLMASYTQFPPDWFGQVSQSNPASADAIRSARDGVNRRGRQVQNQFSDPLEQVQRLIWRFANGGQEPPVEMKRLETDWVDVETSTPSATSDAIFKQVQMGAVPPTSDVTLGRLGYSAVERARLAADRKVDAVESLLAELAVSLRAKEARTDISVAHDISGNQAGSATAGPPNLPPANVQPNQPAS